MAVTKKYINVKKATNECVKNRYPNIKICRALHFLQSTFVCDAFLSKTVYFYSNLPSQGTARHSRRAVHGTGTGT